MPGNFDQRIAAARARLDDALGLRPARGQPAAPPQQPQGALGAVPPAPQAQPPQGGLGALMGAQ